MTSPETRGEPGTEVRTVAEEPAADTTRSAAADPGPAPTVLLPPPEASEEPVSPVDPHGPLLTGSAFDERYEVRALLGEGGMGEVRLCRDHAIGREVALKALRPQAAASVEARSRFLREARIQGQLEHPAIVPVYDLGIAPDGTIYFTMKRVRGLTLLEILRGLRRGEPEMQARYTRRRLLGAFSQACLAIDFAHDRGVLHRDLKPGNLMLGDFGEVHVLDWGVAKLVAGDGDSGAPADVFGSIDTGPEALETRRGEVLGSPGYMAPEQIRGQPLDRRSDVYALGVLLFELLTLRRLHEGKTNEQVLASTLTGADARASVRAPEADVPPELEALCVRATALFPEDRPATARELAEAIERFLDGDRDLELRRRLAAGLVRQAEVLAGRALGGGTRTDEARRAALRELGRVLALDPGHAGAAHLLGRLLVEPPRQVPREVAEELEHSKEQARKQATRLGLGTYGLWLLCAPLLVLMGVRSWGAFLATTLLIVLSAAVGAWLYYRARASMANGMLLLVCTSAAIGSFSTVVGPFVLVPSLAIFSTLLFTMHAEPGRWRLLTIAGGLASIAVPFALELLGLLPPAHAFVAGRLLLLPRMVELSPTLTLGFLLVMSLASTVAPALVLARLRDGLLAAERRLLLQAWQLRHLVPEAEATPPSR